MDSIGEESEAIMKGIAESEMGMELWGAKDLGKYTIGTTTQEKQGARSQDKNMQPVSKLEFQEISDDLDPEDAKLQAEYEQMIEELEGIF